MSVLKVQILKDFNYCDSRSIKLKDGSPRILYSQKAFLNKGGPFPVEFSIGVESPSLAYPVGDYGLHLDCIKVNKFGKLEFDAYDLKLVKLQ
jgi:hypothetical protein